MAWVRRDAPGEIGKALGKNDVWPSLALLCGTRAAPRKEANRQVAVSGLYLMLFLKDSPPPLPWKLVVTPYDLE